MSFEYPSQPFESFSGANLKPIKASKQQKASRLSIIPERNAHLLVLYVYSHNITSPFRICVPYVLPLGEQKGDEKKNRRRRYCLLKRTHEVFLDYVNFSKGYSGEEKGFAALNP